MLEIIKDIKVDLFMGEKLRLSIIIPTINRYEDLENTIKDLLVQSHQLFEIIIVDQTDATQSKNFEHLDNRIIHIMADIKSASAARNIGIKLAKGEILLFLDDDVIIDNQTFLKAHLKAYQDIEIPGVAGGVLEERVQQKVRYDRHKWSYQEETGWLFFPQNYGEPAKIATGRSCNLSVRKSIAIEVGGMDENYSKGANREEADFCMRVYKKYGCFLFSPEAQLRHIGNATGGIRSWTKQARITKAQHHYDGSLYFLFKNVKLRHYPKHLVSIFMFFFFNKELLKRPHLLLQSFWRMMVGSYNALTMLKHPKYLE